jgi:hypothetical protein
MQQTLFGSWEGKRTHTKPCSIAKRRAQTEDEEPTQTLFGPVETKSQARRRAKRIVQLLGAIEDGPEAIRSCENHIDTLQYFIERSLQVELDPNDRDGLQRLVGDTEEVLTESDCEEMRSNPQIWRPYLVGWLGARIGEMYAAALHPKEVAHLRQMQEGIREEASAIVAAVADAQAELVALKAIGTLPEDIAQRYALTPDCARKVRSTEPNGFSSACICGPPPA